MQKIIPVNENSSIQASLEQDMLRILILPETKQDLIQQVLSKLQICNKDDYVQVARWLRQVGASKELVDELSKLDIKNDRDLLLIYLDALAELKQWQAVRSMIAKDTVLDPFVKILFKVRVALELEEPTVADAQFNELISKIKKDPLAIIQVGNYFQTVAEFQYALKCYQLALQFESHQLWAANKILYNAQTMPNVKQVKEALYEIVKVFPENKVFLNQYIYIRLLLDDPVAELISLALNTYTTDNKSLDFQKTLALAYIKNNQPVEAMKLYPSCIKNWRCNDKACNIVCALTMNHNGKTEEACEVLMRIDLNQLNQQEYQFLKAIL